MSGWLLVLAACFPTGIDGPEPEDTSVDLGEVPEDAVVGGDLWCAVPDEATVSAIAPGELPQGPNPCREPVLGRVDFVADGDTIGVTPVDGGAYELVRIIGVDTPEVWGTEECYGPEASAFTKAALADRLVWLSFDGDCVDDFDRTLAYVHLDVADGCFFERLLVRGGYATVFTFSATSTFSDTFEDDEDWAEDHAAGWWGSCR